MRSDPQEPLGQKIAVACITKAAGIVDGIPPTHHEKDVAAWLFHWEGNKQKVVKYVSQRVPAADVEDVVAEVAMKCLRAKLVMSNPADPNEWSRYFMTAVRHQVISGARQHKCLLECDSDPSLWSISASDDIVEAMTREEATRCFWRKVDELPEKPRQIVRLRVEKNLKWRQISEKLSISVEAAKMCGGRALCKLKADPELRRHFE